MVVALLKLLDFSRVFSCGSLVESPFRLILGRFGVGVACPALFGLRLLACGFWVVVATTGKSRYNIGVSLSLLFSPTGSKALSLAGPSFFSFLSFLPSLLSSKVRKLPSSSFGGLSVVESPASSWRSGGASWSEVEVANVDGAGFGAIRPVLVVLLWLAWLEACRWCSFHVGCRDTRQKATGNLSRSGSDRLVVAFPSAFCFQFLIVAEDGSCRYVAFRSEGDTLVVATWWRQVSHRLLVQKATHLWSRSGCLVSGCGLCLGWPTALLGVSGGGAVRAYAYWACLGYKPAVPVSVVVAPPVLFSPGGGATFGVPGGGGGSGRSGRYNSHPSRRRKT
ncbi:hypothetical protein Taro_019016 [Colocasia esculenta]|uniref:Uncharacterized protein n=1 Tax=Colocasia esculenta TaxID=4460 RepID=A0A843V0V7_COLES|nr:hypothetical protein [Colocasia esculenta]